MLGMETKRRLTRRGLFRTLGFALIAGASAGLYAWRFAPPWPAVGRSWSCAGRAWSL